jgi:double-stranded uracil-DNA glycosylase
MNCVNSFPPLHSLQARLLILGSMPGVASLKAQQYYAHPQNLFWKILGSVLGFDPTSSYDERTQHLAQARIAVWDVLASCVREGSLDANIDKASSIPNDFAAFFATHPLIERVCFNGNAAETIFMRQVLPHLPADLSLEYVRLPSTSFTTSWSIRLLPSSWACLLTRSSAAARMNSPTTM